MKKYLDESMKGIANGIAPLNNSKTIEPAYLPNLIDSKYVPTNEVAGLNTKQTFSHEQTFNYDDYNLKLYDNIAGIAAGFKAPRGLFNQLLVDDIVFVCSDNTSTDSTGATLSKMNEGISFYTFDYGKTKVATRDKETNEITTPGYSKLVGYKKIFTVLNDGGLVLHSPSGNPFKLIVDDAGNLSTSPYVYKQAERYEQEEI